MVTALWAGLALLVAAGRDDTQARIEQLFEVIDSASGTTVSPAAVHQQLKKLAPKPRDDYRLHDAYVVALVQQKRYGEALSAVDVLIAGRPAYLPAQRMRIWLLISAHKQREALPAVEKLAASLASADAAAGDETERADAARFLGVTIGYFEGPGGATVTPKALDNTRKRILDRVTGKLRAAYDAGIEDAKAKFADALDATPAAATAVDENRTQDLAERRNDLEKLRAESKKDAETVDKQLRKYFDKLRDEWNKTSASYDEAARQFALYENQRLPIVATLAGVQQQIQQAEQDKNKSRRDQLAAQALPLQVAEANLARQVVMASNAMQRLSAYGTMIQAQMAEVVAEGLRQGLAFAEMDQELKKHSAALAKRQKKHEETVAAKGRKQSERLRAFGEFAEFSYAEEKQRVLGTMAHD